VVIVLRFLRPLRVVRSARTRRILQAARVFSFIGRGFDAAKDVLIRHKLDYAITITIAAVAVGAWLVESFERGTSGGSIGSGRRSSTPT
jgi:hypothetical protein